MTCIDTRHGGSLTLPHERHSLLTVPVVTGTALPSAEIHFARLRASPFVGPSTTRHSKEARKSWLRAERLQGKILSPQLMTGSKDARSHSFTTDFGSLIRPNEHSPASETP